MFCSLLFTGFKRDLKREDLSELLPAERCLLATQALESKWSAKAAHYIASMRRRKANMKKNNNATNETNERAQDEVPKPSLGLCLASIYVFDFLLLFSLRILLVGFNWMKPALLDRFIDFIQDHEQTGSVGFFYLFLLFVSLTLRSLCETHFEKGMSLLVIKVRTSLMNLIYRKVYKYEK